MRKIYLGCALNNSTTELQALVQEVRGHLTTHYELLAFKGLGGGTAEEIVEYDLGQVRKADCMVALCDVASTGLGIEIGTCNALGKPVLLCAQDESVSSMVKGNPVENPHSHFVTYTSLHDLIGKIDDFVSRTEFSASR